MGYPGQKSHHSEFTILLSSFSRDGTDVVTKLNLEIDEQLYESRGRSLTDNPANELEKLLQETVSAGTIGALTLDKEYLIFEPAQCK